MPNEVVTVEYNGEIITLEVPEGSSEADIKSFLSGSQPEEPKRSAFDTFARSTGEPFNRGVAGLLDLPVNLINATSAGISAVDRRIARALGGEGDAPSHQNPPQLVPPFTEAGRRAGLIAPPEEQLHGVVPTAFEFTGSSIIPAAGLLSKGSKVVPLASDVSNKSAKIVAREVDRAAPKISPVQGALNQMASSIAKKPGTATAFDVASNFTAATGGEVARGFTDNESIIAMAQLGGGFAPTLAVLTPSVLSKTAAGRATVAAVQGTKETLLPFGSQAKSVAAKRVQEAAGESPEILASRIDVESRVPPAQQTGDPNLIKIQEIILKRDPKLRGKITKELDGAIKALLAGGDFGGDIERARHILNVRSQMAVEEAAIAVAALGPRATPRQISVEARRATERALSDASKLEDVVWKQVDQAAPADVVNARRVLADEVANRSPDADPNDIPRWLQQKLNQSPIDERLMKGLKKQGLISQDGEIDPAILAALERQGALQTRQRTLKDVQTIRSRVLQEARNERGKEGGGNRNKLRILNDIQESLLEDMTATGAKGVDKARNFSRELNNKFRKGDVGKLLGLDKTGAARVAEEDFLDSVIYGKKSATTTKLIGEAASENPDLAIDFIKAKYIESVATDGVVNPTAHDAFIKNLRKKGMFEVFPELEGQLNAARSADSAARALSVPDSHVNTSRLNQHQSRAALMLQADPGQEMKLILKSNNPREAMRDIVSKIQTTKGFDAASKKSALQGLKTSFVEEIFSKSHGSTKNVAGEILPDGLNMKRLLGEYRTTMRALQMTDDEIARVNTIAEKLRRAQVSTAGTDVGETILDKPLSTFIDLAARWAGARSGGRLGGDIGSGLVLANAFSAEGRKRVLRMTTSQAEQIMIDAATDPALYKSLLVGPTATMAQKREAARIIDLALAASEVTGGAAISSLEDEE